MKGQVPRGFVVLKAGVERDRAEIAAELVQMVRDQIGAIAALKDVAVVAALPKTRSGKILRKTMRGIADGADEPIPSTIDDASVLDALRPVLRQGSGWRRRLGRFRLGWPIQRLRLARSGHERTALPSRRVVTNPARRRAAAWVDADAGLMRSARASSLVVCSLTMRAEPGRG